MEKGRRKKKRVKVKMVMVCSERKKLKKLSE